MPTRLATRSASRAEDVATPRTTRTTSRAATTRAKKAEPEAGNDDEILAKEMERILKVSDPEPQARLAKGRNTTAVAVKGKVEQANTATVKKTASTTSARTTVKAPVASTSKPATTAAKPTARTISKTATVDPAAVPRRTASSTVTRPPPTTATSTAPERRAVAASSSRVSSAKGVDSSRPVDTASSTPRASTAAGTDIVKPRINSSTAAKPRPTTSSAVASASGIISSKVSAAASTSAKVSITKPPPPAVSAPSKPVATTSTTKASSSSTPRGPIASSSRNPPITTAPLPASFTSRPAVSSSTRPRVSLKGKEKEMVVHELSPAEYPWSDTANPKPENASLAMAAVKASLALLGAAFRVGFQYGGTKDDWTGERIDKELGVCDSALSLLRGLDEKGSLGSKGLEVEKAAQAVIGRTVTLGMPRRAFNQLVAARVGILRQYQHSQTSIPKTSAPTPFEGNQRLDLKWLECCWLPCAQQTEMSEQLRQVCVQQLAAAWSCLIGIEGYGYDLPPFKELLQLSVPEGWLHPLQIARLDPPRIHVGPMQMLTKHVKHIPMSAPHWSHVFTVLLRGYVIMVTEGEVAPPGQLALRSPNQLWELMKKWLAAYIPHSDVEVANRRYENAARVIADILEWSESVIETRSETPQKWFSGKAFTDLLEFWIDLSRKSRNPAYVVRAVSLMSGSASSGPHSRSGPSVDVDMISTLSPADREADLAKLFGQFALVETLVTEVSPDMEKLDQALQAVQWDMFGPAVGDLGDASAELQLYKKMYRAFERSRRPVVKLHDTIDESARDGCRQFLLGGTAAVEQALTRTILVDTPEFSSFVSGAVSAISHVLARLQPSTDLSTITELLERGKRICWLSRTPETRSTCLGDLGQGASSLAAALQRKGQSQNAAIIGRQSIDITKAALEAYRQMEKSDPIICQFTLNNRWRTFDTLSISLLANNDREGAIRAAAQMLAVVPPRFAEKLETADEALTTKAIFKELTSPMVDRLAFPLCGDLEPIGIDAVKERAAVVFEELRKGEGYSTKVVSLLAERLFESLLLRAYKPEPMELAYMIGEGVLEMLTGDHQALRRLRILSRLMLLASSSGTRLADFDQLATRARLEIDALRSRQDTNSVLNAEYHAIVLMLQAFQTYQVEEQSARIVIPLATEVIHELRQLLIPPSRSPQSTSPSIKKTAAATTGSVRIPTHKGRPSVSNRSVSVSGHPKTTTATASSPGRNGIADVKKRRCSVIPITEFDDIALLATMLSSLISLLGLLGDIMAQVDAIKVLRALLRHREDMLNDYVMYSGELASLYSKLGKHTRAANVFAQALRTATDNPKFVNQATLVVLHLRHCDHLASSADEAHAVKAYTAAEEVFLTLESNPTIQAYFRDRIAHKNAEYERLALAHRALATISLSRDDAAGAIKHRKAVVMLVTRSINNLVSLAMDKPKPADGTKKEGDDNPFSVAPAPAEKTGSNEPSKDATMAAKSTSIHPFANKYTSGVHWKGAEVLIDAYLDLAGAYAQRGSAADALYYFAYADAVAKAVRSSAVIARTATKAANLRGRMNKLDLAQEKLKLALDALVVPDGPDAYDLQRVEGDILARRQMTDEAKQVFEAASKGIHGLDTVFSAADALLPSPKKEALARVSLSMSTMRSSKEPLLPSTLSQILRRQAWLYREAGLVKESDELYRQVQLLQSAGDSKAEESYLAGKLALDDAFNHFQSDLFMSSLTESTIAMPMGTPGRKVDHRQSTRHRIQVILEQADVAYQSALELVAGSGKVEDVRQACLSLALLRAFQTSLGQGGSRVTSFAADLLASSTSIGLHREILEAIEGKFVDVDSKDLEWPTLDGKSLKGNSRAPVTADQDAEEDVTTDPALVEYWNGVRSRHQIRSYLSPEGPSYDLSVLPETWAIVSISVTEDRNTMFISRHQNGHDPLVFCLPLDRQSKREGEEEDVFTFDAGILELKTIIELSEECSKRSKLVQTEADKAEWWNTKWQLDERMKELINNVEFCWLGAFKTIFNPRQSLNSQRLELFRTKIEKVFNLALFGSPHDSKKYGKIHLSDSLLECFATLSSKSRDEEIEDFIYFILDIYQFHGVPVAVSELDLDQVGLDVVSALTEMEASSKPAVISPVDGPEHLLLALDKNTQAIPWESMPCLRGRPVSRIPSLPVLLDQVALGNIIQPGSKRRTVNSKKTHFLLNPSGDLKVTQGTFEAYLTDMKERAGWKGVIGEKVSELEMSKILTDSDLFLYFGHGGGEQYIRGAKVRTLPKCATTFLWGCSSGKLDDQGDLDPAGTAWNYMMAGCPSLTATLWDVTDRDIDRYTTAVYKHLGLDPAHVLQQEKPRAEHSKMGLLPLSNQGMGLSTVEAVNMSREECKMKYLTGAAVVHYGIPVYIY